MKLDLDSLERIVPTAVDQGETTGGEALGLSLERYAFASRHVRPGRLLDVGCGVGYGTHLLAAGGPVGIEARGVDIAPEAIAYAREHYGGPRTAFEVHDAMSFSDPRGFDSIVSIETIEHLPDPAGFVARLAGLLRPGGVIVASGHRLLPLGHVALIFRAAEARQSAPTSRPRLRTAQVPTGRETRRGCPYACLDEA